MTKYNVTTDAVMTTIEANSADEAAAKFAGRETLYRSRHITTADALSDAAEEMGGWANVTEAE